MASVMWLLAGALAAVPVAAQAAPPAITISWLPDVPDWQTSSAMSLQITTPGAAIVPLTYTVVPLTASLGLNQSDLARGSVHIRGRLVAADETTYTGIKGGDDVAYLCCDGMNSSTTDQNRMLETLMSNRPRAILLYSQQGNCCSLQGSNLPYQTIFTMADADEAADTLNITNSVEGPVQAAISGNVTTPSQDNQESQSGNNSAVAMSILYSITGLITLLFLVIIGTGALRAHRNPERYGPRSGNSGRPRQSRAKGIARAVLETIPIVKFGTPAAAAKPDPNIELESGPGDRPTTGSTDDNVCQAHHLSTIPEDAEALPRATNSAQRESRIGPNAPLAVIASSQLDQIGDEHLGCSICTEDFTVGEDVRVLPCDHKFHPPCIDPWLINVSGTCPLCRLDLRPTQSAGNGSNASQDSSQLPPPLGAESEHDEGEQSTGGQRRRSSRFFDLNRLRYASVEERLEVLRRYRSESQQQATSNQADREDERKRTAKLTDRLRDKFRIRTRTQSSRST